MQTPHARAISVGERLPLGTDRRNKTSEAVMNYFANLITEPHGHGHLVCGFSDIQREEMAAKKSIRESAKRGDLQSAKVR